MQSYSRTGNKRQLFNPDQYAQHYYYGPTETEADADDVKISTNEDSAVKGYVNHYILLFD